jgi:hypothetical protein
MKQVEANTNKERICSLGKRKAIPLEALTGPEGSKRLRFLHFKTKGT